MCRLPWWLSGKESGRHGFYPWVGNIPWRRKWQLTPVFLPGKFHGQRSLAGYSPWGHRVRHNWVTKPLPPPEWHTPCSQGTMPRPQRADFNHLLMILFQTFLTHKFKDNFPTDPTWAANKHPAPWRPWSNRPMEGDFPWGDSSILAKGDPEAWRGQVPGPRSQAPINQGRLNSHPSFLNEVTKCVSKANPTCRPIWMEVSGGESWACMPPAVCVVCAGEGGGEQAG